ncbi:MAG: hypothetical protein U9O20_01340 [Patescibacteria group bacterium]|nr:hypothetical protein [Patescibacteria group bacterium]
MAQRDVKRFFILIVYFLFLFLFLFVVYFLFKADPSCFDGKHNQGEDATDCGGPCVPCSEIIKLQPIKIESVEWIHDIENKYDVVAEVVNPNDVFGVVMVRYQAKVKNGSEGMSYESKWQESFILPGESKYLFVQGFEIDASLGDSANIEVIIDEDSVVWEKFKSYEEPNLIINNPGYEEVSGGGVGFGRAFGTIINRSNVDLEIVRVKVLLFDDKGKLLAVNSQIMNTLTAGEFRDYVINFPHRFPGSVSNVKAFPESNPFDSENYIRVYGRPDKWDER